MSYNGYNYHDIMISGDLSEPKFNGELHIDDPHIKGDFNGLIDVSKAIHNYDFTATIDHLDLSGLHFVKDSVSIIKGDVVMDMRGTGIEDAKGVINFKNMSYQTMVDTYSFKDFDITSTFDDKEVRTIAINSSDIVNGSVEGIFKFNEVVPLFKNAIGSLYTNYKPDKRKSFVLKSLRVPIIPPFRLSMISSLKPL